jgi:hypothetical protein
MAKFSPSQDRKDPWGQNFDEFKAHHQSDRNKIPKSSVFDVREINNFISATGATKIAFYAMKHPNPVNQSIEQGLMVAVGFTDKFERLADVPYLPAEHNCPDDCQTDPFGPPKYKPKPPKATKKVVQKDIKKSTTKAPKKVAKKATKKVAKKRPIKR